MTQGTIKSLRDDRGFGFIAPDNSTQDLFFHSSAVEHPTFDELREGQRVEFVPGTDPRNPTRQRAEHVRLSETTATADMIAQSAATE
jgi:CspA family cold shock protein